MTRFTAIYASGRRRFRVVVGLAPVCGAPASYPSLFPQGSSSG